MLDIYKKDVYGAPEWSCGRARLWVIVACVLYSLLSASLIIYVMTGRWESLFPAAAAVVFFLWRIYRLHGPVALVCADALLVLAPGRRRDGAGWKEWMTEPVYYVLAYDDIAGFSSRWDAIYLGTAEAGGMVKVPAPLRHVSEKDRDILCRRIEEKQRRWMTRQGERKDRYDG